jgi:hypothetical protein
MSQNEEALWGASMVSANINRLIKLDWRPHHTAVTPLPIGMSGTQAPAMAAFGLVNSGTISTISMAAKMIAQPT